MAGAPPMSYSSLFMEFQRTKELLMAEASNNRKLREGRTKLRKSLETIAAAHKQITAELQHAQCRISTLQGVNADYTEGEKRLYEVIRENERVIANYRGRDKLHAQERVAPQRGVEYREGNMDVFSWNYDQNVITIKAQLKEDAELKNYGTLGRVALKELAEKSVVLEARQAGLTAAKVTIAQYRTMVEGLRCEVRACHAQVGAEREENNQLAKGEDATPRTAEQRLANYEKVLRQSRDRCDSLEVALKGRREESKRQRDIVSMRDAKIATLKVVIERGRDRDKLHAQEKYILQEENQEIEKLEKALILVGAQRDDYRERLHRSGNPNDIAVVRYTAEIKDLRAALDDLNYIAREHRERAERAEHAWEAARTANSNLRESLRIKRSASSHLSDMVDDLKVKLRDSENTRRFYEAVQRT